MTAYKARQKLLHTFHINHLSDVDGRRYEGDFTTRKLTIRDLAALGVRKTQLNGGFHHDADNPGKGVDEQTDEFNNMLAHLEMALVKKPDWWNLDEVTDLELMGRIYKEVITFENSFLGRGGRNAAEGNEGHGGGGEGDSSSSSTETDPAGKPSEVVDSEVQSSLEP